MAQLPPNVSAIDSATGLRRRFEGVLVQPGRFPLSIGALTAGLAMLVAAEWLVPGARFAVEAPQLDIVISTTELVVAALVAALAWSRFADEREPAAVYEAAAFTALATGGLLTLVSGTEAQQGVIYFWAAVRALAAGLLVVVGLALLGRASFPGRKAVAIVTLPVLAVVVLAVVAAAFGNSLPALIDPGANGQSQLGLQAIQSVAPARFISGATPLDVALQLGIAALFLIAAGLATIAHARRASVSVAALAVGLVLAAFSQVHEAVDPTSFSSLVCTGDGLRLGFNVVLLGGILAQRRADLRELRAAYRNLDRLHEVDLERRALDERNRAARDVHDGIVQDLWLIRLRLDSLDAQSGVRPAARRELLGLIDRSIEDARRTIATLRGRAPATEELGRGMERLAGELEAATGIRTDLELEPGAEIDDEAVRSEVLRVVAEALANAGRHADATVVRVAARRKADGLQVSVADNGVGFNPQAARGLGLESMRSRAARIGAELTIRSEPAAGTEVRMVLGERERAS